ncbi:MAG: response regulator transcription factor [SAR202 cluster bacterium]|nr:response regulator transcription factor [SAR202 cluster bacterium]
MAIRLLVVDDHALVRAGLIKLLAASREIEVVGEAQDGFEALTKAHELMPDAILMGLFLPGMSGVEVTRLIKRDLPDVQVIILTASSEEENILGAIQAGARGYIGKSADAPALLKQIKQVVQGGVGMSDDIAAKLVAGLGRGYSPQSQSDSNSVPTTKREDEVLALVSRGMTNKEIAQELVVSENTVRAHVRSLMQKLNVVNRTQLAVYGIREGNAIERPRAGADGRYAPEGDARTAARRAASMSTQ